MPPEPPDSAELDALLDMERSEGYGLVRRRLEEELERWRTALETRGAGDYERGQVAMVRTALSLPEILKSEIKDALEA